MRELIEENIRVREEMKGMMEIKEEMEMVVRDNGRLEKELEMNTNHLETKVRLLKEALNKRNEDVKELEANNNDLVKLLEK